MLKSTLHSIQYILPFSRSCTQISFFKHIPCIEPSTIHELVLSPCYKFPHKPTFPLFLSLRCLFKTRNALFFFFFFFKSRYLEKIRNSRISSPRKKFLSQFSRSYNSVDRVEAMIWGNDLTSARQHRGWRNETMRKRESIKAGQ